VNSGELMTESACGEWGGGGRVFQLAGEADLGQSEQSIYGLVQGRGKEEEKDESEKKRWGKQNGVRVRIKRQPRTTVFI